MKHKLWYILAVGALLSCIAPIARAQSGDVLLTVNVGQDVREVVLSPSTTWQEQWQSSPNSVDIWVASRSLGQSYVFEVEVSNASVVVGQQGRTRVEGSVYIRGPPGWDVLDPFGMPFPSFYPPQRTALRRFGLVPQTIDAQSRFRVNEYVMGQLLGTWTDRADNYGPAGLRLPTLTSSQAQAMASRDNSAFRDCLKAVQLGQPWHYEDWEDGPVSPPVPGWGAVWGSTDTGAPAGSGIQFARGYQRNVGFARLSLLASMLCAARERVQYRRSDGAPLSVDDYPGPGPSPDYKPGSNSTNEYLPEFVGTRSGTPDPIPREIDPAHHIREDGWWIAGWEMTGSPGCARMIHGQAEESRLIYSERGPVTAFGYTPENVRNWLIWLAPLPRHNIGYNGTIFGRQIGWPMWVAAESLKIKPDNPGMVVWLRSMDQALSWAVMPSGLCQRMYSVPLWNDQAHDSAQAFEVVILDHGWYAARLRLGMRPHPAIVQSAHSLLDPGPRPGGGPWHFTYIADHHGATYQGPLTLGQGNDPATAPGDPTHAEALCALAHTIDGDVHWLELSAKLGLQQTIAPDWHAKWHILENMIDLGWQANLLARMQLAQ